MGAAAAAAQKEGQQGRAGWLVGEGGSHGLGPTPAAPVRVRGAAHPRGRLTAAAAAWRRRAEVATGR